MHFPGIKLKIKIILRLTKRGNQAIYKFTALVKPSKSGLEYPAMNNPHYKSGMWNYELSL